MSFVFVFTKSLHRTASALIHCSIPDLLAHFSLAFIQLHPDQILCCSSSDLSLPLVEIIHLSIYLSISVYHLLSSICPPIHPSSCVHTLHVKVRGQLSGVSSLFHHVGPRVSTRLSGLVASLLPDDPFY